MNELSFVGKTSLQWLSVEEQTLIKNAVLALPSLWQKNNVRFWGKITGATADYLIVSTQIPLEEEQDYPDSTFFFCTNHNFRLKELPKSSLHPSVSRSTPFTGNPMTELVAVVEAAEENEEENGSNTVQAYHELDLLAAVVAEINNCTAVVPRGAFVASPCHKVVKNRNFTGLNKAEATDVGSYFHFREPKDAAAVRTSDGLIKQSDFLDAITSTHPAGAWSIQLDECESEVVIRSLLFPGYTFVHQVGTTNFGGVYVGDGQENRDLAFML